MPQCNRLHMVGLSAVCWALWKSRNSVCLEEKIIRSPTEIICLGSSFLSYWAGLQTPEDKACLEMGAEVMKGTALHFYPQEANPNDTGMVLLQ
ncbi:hypothetical protein SETIT_9G479600v2 [Setaria italica]|uniref:Uncharacterized protein n=1 Tax=Setaria italica TaxID=4555 RepID=A0A368STL7_SETIT|nr:hypothetical protein SETIT_9G479600v2 [Setaria italica]